MDLLADLVAIDSVNPALVPGAAGEREIAGFVAEWLRERGLDVSLHGPAARPSVVGVARGRGGGASLMLCAHTDTVSVAGMSRPHEPRIEDGRLYGRGAFDMKGGLAAIMLAAVAAATLELRGDVIVAAVSDEEYASDGVQEVVSRWSADACIVTEPTHLRACIAHKGFIWAELETHGVAAHGSRVDLGVDAIAGMGPVLAGIPALQARLNASPHPLLGPGSLHASLISGGVELSSYPDRCVLSVERRTVPGETAESVEAELRSPPSMARCGWASCASRSRSIRTRRSCGRCWMPRPACSEPLPRCTPRRRGWTPRSRRRPGSRRSSSAPGVRARTRSRSTRTSPASTRSSRS
jgi:acetylornithine deacetylase